MQDGISSILGYQPGKGRDRDGAEKADAGNGMAEYEKGVDFKNQLNLYDTVRSNEDFYIGKQWEGVQSNGLPTPVFNFIKRSFCFWSPQR
jgi:hypothetical protein